MFYEVATADVIEYGILKENAKVNRNEMTKAESLFGSVAKASGLGQKCRRQYIIGQYIVDFFFRNSLLIVELDGEYHFTKEQQEAESIRQMWLEQQGYKVLRFKNEEVLYNMENVINKIINNFKPYPSGIPPLKGDKRGSL